MFRFTIRDVLWLTVVVALAAGWGLDRWQTNDAWFERIGSLELELHKEGLAIYEGEDGALHPVKYVP